MKQTRQIFILKSDYSECIDLAIKDLRFKGLMYLPIKEVTEPNIEHVFANNKSVLCAKGAKIPRKYFKDTHVITIVYFLNSYNTVKIRPKYNVISEGGLVSEFSKLVEELNVEIGDYKLNVSEFATPDNCAYCKYMHGENKKIHDTIYESPNFYVTQTLGQFATGYLLIIPKRHIMSYAQLTPTEMDEFKDVLNDVLYILKTTYPNKNFIVFENGTGHDGKGKAKDSIVHAHMHVAPCRSLTPQKVKDISKFNFQEITLDELHKYSTYSYLLLSEDNIWSIVNNPFLFIPRQYIRQLIAEEYNIPGDKWNWRIYPFYDKMVQTAMDIENMLWVNFDTLPERILTRCKKFLTQKSQA